MKVFMIVRGRCFARSFASKMLISIFALQAAMKALKTLTEMGLDSVYSGNLKNDYSSGGNDG